MAIDIDAVCGMGFGFVVGLVTGLVVDVWAWRLKRSDGQDVRWATTHILLLPGLWLGVSGTGWAGSAVLRVLQLRPFLGWYFLTAVAVTALCVCPVLTRFIMAIGLESGKTVSRKRTRGRSGPHLVDSSPPAAAQSEPPRASAGG